MMLTLPALAIQRADWQRRLIGGQGRRMITSVELCGLFQQ
jgi:hypothetical protein